MEVLRNIEWYREVTNDRSTWAGPNGRGERYLEIFMAFPWMRNLYTKWELELDTYPMFHTMRDDWSPIVPVRRSCMTHVAFGL